MFPMMLNLFSQVCLSKKQYRLFISKTLWNQFVRNRFLKKLLNNLWELEGLKFAKKQFFKIVKSLVTALLKMEYLYEFTIYLQKPLLQRPTENCYIKIRRAYFNDFNILFKTVLHWKTYILLLRLF